MNPVYKSKESQLNDLSSKIIGAAIQVHSALGPGLLESTYETCLTYELRSQDIRAATQVALPVKYKGITLNAGYRVDLIIEDSVIVELKAVDSLTQIHTAQILAYLKLSQLKLGLLINFNVLHLKDGIKRVVNRF